MEKLIPFIMCAVFILAAYGLLKLSLFISSYFTRKKILSYGVASEDAATALFCSYFGMKNVLSRAVLPVYTSAGKRYTEIDNIIVLPTCVVVIEIKSMIGRIDNPEGAQTWRQSAVTRTGEHKELDFRNPFIQNDRHAAAVKEALKNFSFAPPVYGLVVFTSPRVSFVYKDENILRPTQAVDRMQQLSLRGRKLTGEQKSEILSRLRSLSKKSAPYFAKQVKMRQSH